MYKKMLLAMLVCMLCFTGCSKEEAHAEPTPQQTVAPEISVAPDTDTEQEPEEEKIKVSLMEDGSTYAYDTLDKNEKIWYDEIVDSLSGMSAGVRLNERVMEKGLNENSLDKIFQCVMLDHPELFYVDGYTYTSHTSGGRAVAIDFKGSYTLTMKEAKAHKEDITRAVNEILAGAEGLTSDYDKVKYVYDTIILNTEYNEYSSDNQNIYSVFVNGESVCQGYAKATQYLLNQLDVECILVQGSVYGDEMNPGQAHVWNLVNVDGKYYHLDTTWGDVSYNMEGAMGMSADQLPQVSYDYFCVTTEQVESTHSIDSILEIPECKDTAANYFVHEDTLFKNYDKQKARRLFANQREDETRVVAMKAANHSCYDSMKSHMIDQQGVFEYVENDKMSVYYSYNDSLLTLTFWVTNE